MNKPIILIIEENADGVTKRRAEFMKNHVLYSDDFVETNDARYYVRSMSVNIDMDKILIPPPEGLVAKYEIEGFIKGMEKKLEDIKKIAGYKPGNVQSTPPPEFGLTAPPMAAPVAPPVGGTSISGQAV